MLNAFRHQRDHHGIRSRLRQWIPTSAQRLSASEGSSLSIAVRLRRIHPGAQRLSASEGSSPFRYSKEVTHRWACAQRLSASEGSSQELPEYAAPGWQCSTPFGIRGIITDAWTRSNANAESAQRLSASEGSSHAGGATMPSPAVECSTPFGIRGIITHLCHACQEAGNTCSTPFGIRGIITADNSRTCEAIDSAYHIQAPARAATAAAWLSPPGCRARLQQP